MGYIENKCSGSGRRREGGLGKGLAAVLYTIRSQTDCWKRNDGGGCNKDVYSLTDAETVLNRDHTELAETSGPGFRLCNCSSASKSGAF